MVLLILEKNAVTSNPQQSDITNSMIETNTQTTNYTDENYFNNNKAATFTLNPTPPLIDNYVWIPATSDNVAPG